MTDDNDPEHCSEVFQLDEGDTVTLVLDSGDEVEATLDDKSDHHDESGPHIQTQTTLKFTRESDGMELSMARTDGLSGLPDADPFPSFFPLYERGATEPGREIPDEHVLGYVDDVRHWPWPEYQRATATDEPAALVSDDTRCLTKITAAKWTSYFDWTRLTLKTMTDHKPGDVVGLFGHKVQIEVTTDHADQRNSYRTVSRRGDDPDTATVTVEAEQTFFQYDGDVFMFDGVTYRPNSDYRDDEGYTDGEVSLVHPDGFPPDEGHRFNPLRGNFTLGDFVDMLVNGELEPTTNPHSTHD